MKNEYHIVVLTTNNHKDIVKNKIGDRLNNFHVISPSLKNNYENYIKLWHEYIKTKHEINRFNNPSSFTREISKNPNAKPLAIIIMKNQEIFSLVRARLNKKPSSYLNSFLNIPTLSMNTLHIDHSCIQCEKNEIIYSILDKILNIFLETRICDCIDIRYINKESDIFIHLDNYFKKRFYSLTRKWNRWQTLLIDKETNQPIKLYKSKKRNKLKNDDKKLERFFDNDVFIKYYKTPEELDEFIQLADQINKKTYHKKLGTGVDINNRLLITYLREICHDGIFLGFILFGKNLPIAYGLGDITPKTFRFSMMGHDPEYSNIYPGAYSTRKAMEKLAAEGVMFFDFGWGDSILKQKLSTHCLVDVDIQILAKRIKPFIHYISTNILISSENFLRHHLLKFDNGKMIRKLLRRI